MSGLEIAAGVAGIISAFVTVGRAVRSLQEKRKQKKLALLQLNANTDNAESRLITTLNDGQSDVKNEYDSDLRRIGPAFDRGDGTFPIKVLS